jgi:RNA polymerase sigma factor (sigma-70 family)
VIFFHKTYTPLIRVAMYYGASEQEAQDAVATTMEDVLRRWGEIDNRPQYARTATISNFIKHKTRGSARLRRRIIEHGYSAPESGPDEALTAWEERQWVTQLLESLPLAQREVMALIVDGYASTEIARLLGKTPETVRKNIQLARTRLKHLLARSPEGEHEPQTCSPPTPRKEAQ